MQRFDYTTGCPSGYTLCNTAINYNYRVCVPDSSHCPINDILIVQNSQTTTMTGYTFRNFTNNMTLAFTTEANSLPLTEFKLTEGQVCID